MSVFTAEVEELATAAAGVANAAVTAAAAATLIFSRFSAAKRRREREHGRGAKAEALPARLYMKPSIRRPARACETRFILFIYTIYGICGLFTALVVLSGGFGLSHRDAPTPLYISCVYALRSRVGLTLYRACDAVRIRKGVPP